jgi:hypothetical protein
VYYCCVYYEENIIIINEAFYLHNHSYGVCISFI